MESWSLSSNLPLLGQSPLVFGPAHWDSSLLKVKTLWDGDGVPLSSHDKVSYRPDMTVDATGLGHVTLRRLRNWEGEEERGGFQAQPCGVGGFNGCRGRSPGNPGWAGRAGGTREAECLTAPAMVGDLIIGAGSHRSLGLEQRGLRLSGLALPKHVCVFASSAYEAVV